MSLPLIILLAVDAVLFLGLVIYAIVKECKSKGEKVCVEEQKCCCCEEECTCECEKVEEVVVTKQPKAEPVTQEVQEQEELEDTEDDREKAKRIPFATKMLGMDAKTQSYYDEINNKFRSMRKINPRVSTKGVSYRLGRELVSKITIRGKTMRLHLALDVNAFENNVYFQKSMGDVKAYEEVPFTVKVKSDRGLKNAIKLIDALVEKNAIEYKTRFVKIDSIQALSEE